MHLMLTDDLNSACTVAHDLPPNCVWQLHRIRENENTSAATTANRIQSESVATVTFGLHYSFADHVQTGGEGSTTKIAL